jgi:hypothetical protein
VNDIRTRAAMAEIAVQNLLSDPTKAEYAKTRLMETSASINELSTLVKTHGDLEYEVSLSSLILRSSLTATDFSR